MDYAATYLKRQQNFSAKWARFMAEDLGPDFRPLDYCESLCPFYGSKHWDFFNEEQRRSLYYLFNQFSAEALMTFEQCFMYSSRRTQDLIQTDTERKAFRHFVHEEFLHTRAFRYYLRREKIFDFPRKSLFFHHRHRLKNIFAWILDREPMAIIIPGAKSEIYTLYYTKLLQKKFAVKDNTYTKLNVIHSQDEVFHVQFDYNFVDSVLADRGLYARLKFIFFTVLMIASLQFVVILGVNSILRRVATEMGPFRRGLWTLRFFRWTLWHFGPYKQTRNNIKAVYKQRPHYMYTIFQWASR